MTAYVYTANVNAMHSVCNEHQYTTFRPLAPGGVSPLHRTGNAFKVFYVAAVGKTCTLLTNPL